MGEARRKALIQPTEEEIQRRLEMRLDYLFADWCSDDPDDKNIMLEHGFFIRSDDNYSELCRYGCGNTLSDIIGYKMRNCSAHPIPQGKYRRWYKDAISIIKFLDESKEEYRQ